MAQLSVPQPKVGLGRGVGQHGVDLPGRAVRIVHPRLVLQRIATGGRLLDIGGQALAGQPAGGGLDLFGGFDLDAQMVQGAQGAGAAPFGVLDQHQLEGRLG